MGKTSGGLIQRYTRYALGLQTSHTLLISISLLLLLLDSLLPSKVLSLT